MDNFRLQYYAVALVAILSIMAISIFFSNYSAADDYDHELVYNLNGGIGDIETDQYSGPEEAHSFTITSNVPTNEGHSFAGWSDTEDGIATYHAGNEISVSGTKTIYAVWTLNEFNLIYDANGGFDAPPEQTFTGAQEAHVFQISNTIPAYADHIFAGWATSQSGPVQYNPGNEVTVSKNSSITLYAIWLQYEYHLAYVDTVGSGAPPQADYAGIENTHVFTVSPITPTFDNHIFAGWATTPGGNAEYQGGDAVSVDRNSTVTLYSVWIQNQFSISYNANGGSNPPNSETINNSSDSHTFIISDIEPVRDNYHFDGWGISPDSTSPAYVAGDEIPVAKNTSRTLYAIWSQNVFTLAYDANKGAGTPATETIRGTESEHIFTISDTNPQRTNYNFLGWSLNSSASVGQYFSGDTISVNAGTSLTLYAIWSQNTLTLTYDANGGTDAPVSMIYIGSENTHTFTLSQSMPVREDYLFTGWSDSSVGDAQYQPGTSLQINADKTIYAVWVQYQYTLIYDANGGQTTPSGTTAYGSLDKHEFTVTSDDPVREGYLFDGWSADSTRISGEYHPGDQIIVSKNSSITLFAIWKQHTYSLVYNGNGGSNEPDSELAYGTSDQVEFVVSYVIPVREHYHFDGWSISQSSEAGEYNGGSIVPVDKNTQVTLYAVWTQNTIILSYDANGGSEAPSEGVYTGTDSSFTFRISSQIPKRPNYVFDGWSDTPLGTVQYNPDSPLLLDSSKTLYAVWSQFTYILNYNANGGSSAPSSEVVRGATDEYVFTITSERPIWGDHFFIGWGASPDSTEPITQTITVVKNTESTLYAIWSQNTIEVVFDANGGTGAPERITWKGTEESHLFNIPGDTPSRDQYIFLGWARTSTATGATVFSTVNVDKNYSPMTLFAVWSQTTVTLSYDANGGTGAPSAQIWKGATNTHTFNISSLIPERDHYLFGGWADQVGGTPTYSIDDEVIVNGSKTVYAVWNQNTYSVVYNANGGTGAPVNDSFLDSAEIHSFTVTSAQPTYNKHRFLGWSTNPDAAEPDILAGDSVSVNKNSLLNLYAVWKQYQYILRYDANQGSQPPADQTWADGTDEHTFNTSTGDLPIRNNWVFSGWSTSPEGPINVGAQISVPKDTARTVYAIWTQYRYGLHFELNGGAGSATDQEYFDSSASHTFTIGASSVYRDHYLFMGWSTDPSGLSTVLDFGSTISVNANNTTTLYAVWSQYTYTLYYNSNYNSIIQPDIYSDNTDIHQFTVRPEGFTRAGYEFLGWSEDRHALYPDVYSGDLVEIQKSETKTLFAIWAQKCGEHLYYLYDSSQHTLCIYGNGPMSNYSSGTAPWDTYRESVTAIQMAETVTEIGDYAFSGFTSITNLPNLSTISRIGNNAFGSCIHVAEAIIPANVNEIGANSFNHCSGLTRIALPEGITVGNGAFLGCLNLVDINLPESMEEISDAAFQDCSSLNTVELPLNISRIGVSAFENCTSLSRIELTEKDTMIGDRAFRGCTSLTYADISKCTQIGSASFENCSSLREMVYPGTLGLNSPAFSGNTQVEIIRITGTGTTANFTEVTYQYTPWYICRAASPLITVDATVTGIGDYFFCGQTVELEIQDNISAIGRYSFSRCSGFTSLSLGPNLSEVRQYAFYNCANITAVTIESPETALGEYSFLDCNQINSLTLPAGFTFIGPAFPQNLTLTNLTFTGVGTVSGYDEDTSRYCPWNTTSADITLTIPEGITGLGSYLFYRSAITAIQLPESLTSIGDSAFRKCTNLTALTIPVNGTRIGSNAFTDCISLKTLTLPASINLGTEPFSGCVLTDVYLTGNEPMTNFNPSPAGDNYCGATPWYVSSLTQDHIHLGDNIPNIGDYAFYDCDSISSIPAGSSVTSFGRYSFANCNLLSDMVFPDGITFSEGTFSNCYAMKSVSFSETYPFDPKFFDGCDQLERITVTPAAIKVYPELEYKDNSVTISNNVQVIIEEGVTHINSYLFANCRFIHTVEIPATVASVGIGAFDNCSGLRILAAPADIPLDHRFEGCDGINEIRLTGTKDMCDYTLESSAHTPWAHSKTSLTSFEISEGAYLGAYTFNGCLNTESIVIDGTIERIGAFAYGNNSNLRFVTIGAGVTYIDPDVFSDSNSISAYCVTDGNTVFASADGILFSKDLRTIYRYPSANTGTYTVDDSIEKITRHAFSGCGIKGLTISSANTVLEDEAIIGCNQLTTLSVPATLLFQHNVFDCQTIVTLTVTGTGQMPDLTEDPNSSYYQDCPWYKSRSALTTVIISEGITYVGNFTFKACSSVKYLYLPQTLTGVGIHAFEGFDSLTEISIPSNIRFTSDIISGCESLSRITLIGIGETVDYSDDESSANYYGRAFWHMSDKDIEVAVSEGITRIGDRTFKNMANIRNVTIPGSVTSIGNEAFMNDTGLSNLLFSSNLVSVGDRAFFGCNALTYMEFKSSSAPSTGIMSFGLSGDSGKMCKCAVVSDAVNINTISSDPGLTYYTYEEYDAYLKELKYIDSLKTLVPIGIALFIALLAGIAYAVSSIATKRTLK